MLQEGTDLPEGATTLVPPPVVLAAKFPEDVVLPTMAGAAPLADFAEVVAADAAALADAGTPFLADLAGSVALAVADPATAGILFPADLAGPVTSAVADSADAGKLFPTNHAGILFPADPAGMLFPADPPGILFPADPAGILFPADPAGTIAADVPFLADADPVTDQADDGAVPLAVPDMTFPAIGLVTGTVACEVDATPMTFSDNYGGVPDSEWTDRWCGGEISRRDNCPAMMVGLVQNDLLNWNLEDPREVFGDRLPAPRYPVIPEGYGESECDDFGDDEYGYYEDLYGRSGSSVYDDPRDYREWDEWSDTDNSEKLWGPFPGGSG